MRAALTAACILFLSREGMGQTVKLPDKVEVEKGRLAAVKIEWTGDDCKWVAPPSLDVFREYDPDAKVIRLRLIGHKDGVHVLHAVACKEGKLSDFATTQIIVGKSPDPDPGPGPGPDPRPPEPQTGKRAIIIYESADKTKMPEKQLQILYSTKVQDYLKANTDLDADGKTRVCGAFDKDDNLEGYSPHLARMLKEPRTALPWVVLEGPGGKHAGPLPADVDAFLALAKKYLEGKAIDHRHTTEGK